MKVTAELAGGPVVAYQGTGEVPPVAVYDLVTQILMLATEQPVVSIEQSTIVRKMPAHHVVPFLAKHGIEVVSTRDERDDD